MLGRRQQHSFPPCATCVAKHTVLKLVAISALHVKRITMLPFAMFEVAVLQCDAIWSSVAAKKKNVAPEQKQEGWGDV